MSAIEKAFPRINTTKTETIHRNNRELCCFKKRYIFHFKLHFKKDILMDCFHYLNESLNYILKRK